jgi:hypothetical protein
VVLGEGALEQHALEGVRRGHHALALAQAVQDLDAAGVGGAEHDLVELEVVVGVADEHGRALVDLGEGAARDDQRDGAEGRAVAGQGDRGGAEQAEAQAGPRGSRGRCGR